MSPTRRTAGHRPTARKLALCAAALVVTILPTACGAAYADDGDDPSEVVEVGGADAAEGEEDSGNSNDDSSGNGEDDGQDTENSADGAADEQAADDEAAAQNEQQQADEGSDNGNNNEGNNNDAGNNDDGNNGNGDNGNGNGNGDNGLDVLGTDCSNSDLQPHEGLEEAPRCVDTSFGEVASEDQSPSLLITDSPGTVQADEEFTMTVSTRNLVRDRFLGAADGGYYKESSFLNGQGIQRGHFHTACRTLEQTDAAPDPAPEPEFFLATEDGGGGAGSDDVQVNVDGLPAGEAQCAVWAGDGSHRVPMMQRANQIPAFDTVRITVE